MSRKLFETTTLKGGFMSLAAVLFLTVVNGGAGIAERHNPGHQQDIRDIVGLLNAVGGVFGVVGFGVTSVGRYRATSDVVTPSWLPGRSEVENG